MGMAASQARLLTITARIHDVEYQAQSIQNAKIQLATQSDEVYQEYLNALDATTLTLKNANGELITANFNNLCGKNATQTAAACKYAIMDTKTGSLVVPDEIEEAYYNYTNDKGEDDPYAFAMWMLGIDDNDAAGILDKLEPYEEEVAQDNKSLAAKQKSLQKILDEASEKTGIDKNNLNCKEDLINIIGTETDESIKKTLEQYLEKYEEAEKSYRYNLYRQNAQEIFTKAGGNELDFNQDDFNYYVQMYKQISANGGNCTSISDYDGPTGDASTNSDWLKNMVESGRFIIEVLTPNTTTGEVSINATSPSTDENINYTTTTSIDKKALAKAEAEYEHATKKIDQKDKKYDMDLSKLESERTALTTEYDSVKKVISDNIERTFGIFS